MINFPQFFTEGSAFAHTELGRIIATVITVGIAVIATQFIQKRARQQGEDSDIHRRRSNLVLAKNLVFAVALVIIGSIWATKIAGAALSLAAVAGAILIVSKEFLLNMLGTATLTVSRPYRVGDFIEMGDVRGRVLETDLLVTTIAETREGHQLTGQTAIIPNSLLLTRPVKNLTATGAYVINLLPVAVNPSDDILALDAALLKAATEVCRPWLSAANAHLQHMESRELVDLPSAEPKVLLQLTSAKEYTLALRYCCRPNDKVKVEQRILRLYLEYRPAKCPAASKPQMAEAD